MPVSDTRAPRGAALRKHRISHGLCPNCGGEAAPYYLCAECRFRQRIRRTLNLMKRKGVLRTEGERRSDKRWFVTPNSQEIMDSTKWYPDPQPGDKRLEPRLGGKIVDVCETLVGILRDMGKPATIEELVHAWGKLREKRKTASLAGDMTTIIEAKRRQDRKAAKRAAAAARHAGASA